MLEQRYRKYYQKIFIEPVLKYSYNVSPILITVIAGIIGLLVIPAIYFDYKLMAVLLLLFSGYLDTLDGSIARHFSNTTKLGGALDIILDRVVESSVIFGFLILDPNRAILCFLMIFANLICITSFLVVGIFVEQDSNKSFFYHNGLIERAEAFIFYILMIILPIVFNILAVCYIVVVLLSAFLHVIFFHNWQKNQPS